MNKPRSLVFLAGALGIAIAILTACEALLGGAPDGRTLDAATDVSVRDTSVPPVDGAKDAVVDTGMGDAPGCMLGDAHCSACCNGTCVNFAGDPMNCGTCAHDCVGGACNDASCAVVAFAAYDAGAPILSIALDDASAYWVDQAGTIRSCSKGVCFDERPTVVTSTVGPNVVAVDRTSLYWTSNPGSGGGVFYCAKDDCDGATGSFGGASGGVGLAVGQGAGFWSSTGQSVLANPLDGGGSVVLASGEDVPGDVVVVGSRVFWATDSDIRVAPTDGGTVTSVFTNSTGATPTFITADATNLYWAYAYMGGFWTVEACSQQGCTTPTALSGMESSVGGVATDGAYVYWTAQETTTAMLRRCATTGCVMPETLYQRSDSTFYGVSVDAQAIYFGAQNSSGIATVYRLAR